MSLTLAQVRSELLAGVDDAAAEGRLSLHDAAQLADRFRAMSDTELATVRDRFAAMARALIDVSSASRAAFTAGRSLGAAR